MDRRGTIDGPYRNAHGDEHPAEATEDERDSRL
jgi:hypothetical protein